MDKKVVYKTAGLLLIILSGIALLQFLLPFDAPFLSSVLLIGGFLTIPFQFFPMPNSAFIFIFYILIGGYFAWLGWKKKPENKTLRASAWIHLILCALFIIIGVGIELFCKISGLSDCSQAMFGFIIPLVLLQTLGFVVLVIGLVKQYVLK